MQFIDIILILGLGFFFLKEISSLRDENENLRNKFDQLAKSTGNHHLAFKFINNELKNKLIELEKNGHKDEAIILLIDETKMNIEDARNYLSKLIENE